MTQKELFKSIRALGMVVTCTDGEYRVNYKGGSESSAYYTDDRMDALGTAREMDQERLRLLCAYADRLAKEND